MRRHRRAHGDGCALVSLPATFAVDDLRAGKTPPGVHGAPSDPATIARWFHSLAKDGARVNTIEAGERAA